jgi:hypothetical protein
MATATTTPTAAATAIPATVSAAIVTAVGAAAKILSGTVVTAAGRIVLRGIVMGREILRRGRIGIRLALLWRFGVMLFQGSGLNLIVMFLEALALGGGRFPDGSMLLIY